MLSDDDLDGDLGTLDVVSMDKIRSTFTRLDGFVEEAGFPNLADPKVQTVTRPSSTARNTAVLVPQGV